MACLLLLGATSVLSVVNIGFGGKSRPQVGYATALDTFIILCFIAVFAALVEFACINFIDTFMKRKKAKEKEDEAKRQLLEQQAQDLLDDANDGVTNEFEINPTTNGNNIQVPLQELLKFHVKTKPSFYSKCQWLKMKPLKTLLNLTRPNNLHFVKESPIP